MKIIGMIPARGGSTRFNNKPLALICGKPMVYWVWKHSKEAAALDEVYVATDSEEIKEVAESFGAKGNYDIQGLLLYQCTLQDLVC